MSTSRSTESAADPLRILARYESDVADPLVVGAAQLGGPWLDVAARMARAVEAAELAAANGVRVLAYPETYLSGYPYWLSRTNGAAFGDPLQKEAYAYYLETALEINGPEIQTLIRLAADLGLTLLVGLTERAGGSAYCTLATITPEQGVAGHHRKLVPTYDERLVWAGGDAAGLRTHTIGAARIGSLNCWENWMPQARQALYADGEDVHFSAWPGAVQLTGDITRFAALEGRVFSVAAGGLLCQDDVPDDFPLADQLRADADRMPFDGGSAIAGPDGEWLVAPVSGQEGLIVAELDLRQVRRERLTFDPTGHYSRPDVFTSTVDRRRREVVSFDD